MKIFFVMLLVATAGSAAELPSLPDQPIAPVVYVGSVVGNDHPRAATNGDTMFVVWHVEGSRLIEGTCLRHDGTPVQTPSIVIGRNANLNNDLHVIWVGGHYLVLWTDANQETFTRRFASDGSSLDTALRPTSILRPLHVVTDGSNVMVVGLGSVQRIDANGQPNASPVPFQGLPLAAGATGKGVVIVRHDGSSEGTAWLGWNGATLATHPLSERWSETMLAEGDGHFLLTGDQRALRVDFDGTPIGETLTLDNTNYELMRAAWNGTSWLVVGSMFSGGFGQDSLHAYRVTRITADGAIDGTATYPDLADGMGVNDLLWNGTRYVAFGGVYAGVTASLFDSLEASVGPSRNVRNVAVSLAATEESGGVIASVADRSLAVWRIRIDASTFALRGAFIVDGLPSAPFEIAPEVEDELPAIATDGVNFLVAWRYGSRVRARTVSSPLLLGSVHEVDSLDHVGAGSMGAAWSGVTWVLGYIDTMVHIVPLSRSGVLGNPIAVPNPTYINPVKTSVSLACDSADCLIVTGFIGAFSSIPEDPLPKVVTCAGRVSRDGTKADPLMKIPMESVAGSPLAMRVNGVSVIINSEDGKSLSAFRLDSRGGKALLVSRTTPIQAVSVDRSGLYWRETQPDGNSLLHWSRLAAGVSPAILSIFDLGDPMPTPVAASSTSRQSFVLFSDGESDPGLLATRLFVRTFASPDPLAPIPQPRRRATK